MIRGILPHSLIGYRMLAWRSSRKGAPLKKHIALCVVVLMTACASTGVTDYSRLYNLKKDRPAAMTYDARGRGAYISHGPDLWFCAEPPPDVAANLASQSSTKAAANAALAYGALNASASGTGESSQTVTSEIANAATRTELVLVLRDALYRLCEMRMKNDITAEQAKASYDHVIEIGALLAQRDNVAKLIALLTNKDSVAALGPTGTQQILNTIRALSLVHAASAAAPDSFVKTTLNAAAVSAAGGTDIGPLMDQFNKFRREQPSIPPSKPPVK